MRHSGSRSIGAKSSVILARSVPIPAPPGATPWRGTEAADPPRSTFLAELALELAARVLKGGGDALIKL
jgi:23S rRNA U2552 (ribose-2'-O)-methylase RlmE/FtsJ